MSDTTPAISLRTRLIVAMTAMALIPLLIANYFTFRLTEDELINKAFTRNQILAEKVAGKIDQMFAEKIRLLKVTAVNPDVRSMDPARLVPALKPLPEFHPELLMAIALSPDGDLVARSDGRQMQASYLDREYFHTAIATGQTAISDVLVSRTTGKLDIAIAEPLMNPDQSLLGMIVIGVSLEKIIETIATTRIGATGYAFIVSRDGTILIHPDLELVVNGRNLSGLPPIRAAIAGDSGSLQYDYQDTPMLASYSVVPTTGWGLIVHQPLEEALEGAAKLKRTNILIVLTTTLAAFFLALALAGIIFRPIGRLIAVTRKVAGGDFSCRADVNSKDEIGTLATAFNQMLAHLEVREKALRKSQERYRRIIDTSNEGIIVLDQYQRISFINNHLGEMMGYLPAEVTGLNLESFLFDEDVSEHTRQMHNRIQGQSEQYERRWKHRDGSAVWTIVSATPIFNENGQYDGSFAMITDISQRKQAEEERIKLQHQLNQAQKIESIGQLAGGIAHDFNNMLGIILGHTEMALIKSTPENPLVANLCQIKDAAQRSADLTKKLLTFARKQIITPKVLDLNDALAGVLSMVERIIGENIHLSWKPGEALWRVKIDPSQVDQIVANLCVNARDAIPGIGTIAIETANVTFDEEFASAGSDVPPGDYVRLSVSDNGNGIDKDSLDHIFEPFYTTKDIGKGTGLGLSTVYGAVKQNQGYISVYSQPGMGTTFHIYLPRVTDPVEHPETRPRQPLRRGSETILLVEDDPNLLQLKTAMLERCGYQVLPAAGPAQALDCCNHHQGAIPLMITDVIMPEMTGKELAQRLQTTRPEMRFIFMSGYTADIISQQGIIDEGVVFLQKPVPFEALIAKVQEILDGPEGDITRKGLREVESQAPEQ